MSEKVTIKKGVFSNPLPVSNNNWAKDYPYAPEVSVEVKHDSATMTLLFKVREQYTKAEIKETNGRVWTDSCVEFFISFGDEGYYNLETTCAGVELLGFKDSEGVTTHAPESLIDSILKKGTYVGNSFPEKEGDNSWQIEIQIPCSAFFHHKLESFDGIKARGNFFKCGDDLSHPHFLSWSPIDTPKPNFHVPQFFGDIEFE